MSRLVIGLTLVGLGASAASLYVHYRLLSDPGYTSFCDVSATMSCTQVYMSRFGSVRGVPVALGGLLWFALTLLLALVGVRGAPVTRETIPGYLFALSTVGLAAVLYFAYASFFVLKTVCVLCVTTYAAVIGLFIISGAATTFPMTSLPRHALRDVRGIAKSPAALALTLLFLLGSGLLVAYFPRDGASAGASAAAEPAPLGQDQRAQFEQWYTSQPRRDVPVPADGASVVIVKFNDYQCPPCKQTFMDYKGIVADYQKKYPGKIKYVTKDYPLDPECNAAAAKTSPHVAACEAAVAVRLARRQSRDKALEEWIFANQSALTPEVVKTAAREVGGVTDFDAQYKTQLEAVKSDIALGGLLGVEATPTFYINGVLVRGGLATQFFQAALDFELKRAGAGK